MSIHIETLSHWTADLGFNVTVEDGPTGSVLRATTETGEVFLVHTADTERGQIRHERRISRADADALWGTSAVPEAPDAFTHVVENLANGFPLVGIHVSEDGDGFLVSFTSLLYLEELNRQAYALTLSSVMKAAATFDMLQNERARQIEAWAELGAGSAASESSPAEQPTSCPNCGAPVESGDIFCESCGHALRSDQERGASRALS